jgi:hypothetical protein
MTKKLYWIVIAILVFSCAVLYLAIKENHKSEVEKALSQFALAMNAGAPRKVDESTTLERTYAKELNIFIEYSVEENTTFNEEQKSKLLTLFNEVVCQTPRFKDILLKNGVAFHYSYKLSPLETRVFVFSLEDCY